MWWLIIILINIIAGVVGGVTSIFKNNKSWEWVKIPLTFMGLPTLVLIGLIAEFYKNTVLIIIIIIVYLIIISAIFFAVAYFNVPGFLGYEAVMLSRERRISYSEAVYYLRGKKAHKELASLEKMYADFLSNPKLDFRMKKYFDREIAKQKAKIDKFESHERKDKENRLRNKETTMKQYIDENELFIEDINVVHEFIRLIPREEAYKIDRYKQNFSNEKLQFIDELLTERQKIEELTKKSFPRKDGANNFKELRDSIEKFYLARKELENIDNPDPNAPSEFPDIDFDKFDKDE